MATYKVIQDIESEDKLLGPLTLRQFVYAAIVVVLGFVAFKLAALSPFLIIPFLLPIGFFGLLAAPFGHDQSSEVWLLAKISFMLKPRRRIWDQSGIQQLVTITVPKKIEKYLTDGLTQTEVKSRLRALANTIDSRGWAVKNVNVNLYNQPSYLTDSATDSDRLLDAAALPQDVPNYEVMAEDDILDAASNPTAQHLDAMISQAAEAHRQTLQSTVQGGGTAPQQPAADYWFMSQPSSPPAVPAGQAAFQAGPTIVPGSQSADDNTVSDKGEAEQALLDKIHKQQNADHIPTYGHMRTLDPNTGKAKTSQHSQPVEDPKTKAEIARLAANDDLNVATIAREADKATKQLGDDEVVISLR